MTQKTRTRATRRAAALVAATVAVTLTITWRVAAAAVGYAAVDPIGGAQASVDGAVQILTTYGPATGGMYLLFATARALVTRYAKSSWLASGKRLAYLTSALGIVGAALQAQVSGAPWTVVLSAAVAAIFKLITPGLTDQGDGGQGDRGPATSATVVAPPAAPTAPPVTSPTTDAPAQPSPA